MSYAHLQAAWSEWLIEALCSCGVRRAVVSPGSRSTPLVLAIARFEAEGRLTASVAADERVAGFMALGQAKMTGIPTLLVCTSGTAGSHYYPAVIEAYLGAHHDAPLEVDGEEIRALDGGDAWGAAHSWNRSHHGGHMYHPVIVDDLVIVEPQRRASATALRQAVGEVCLGDVDLVGERVELLVTKVTSAPLRIRRSRASGALSRGVSPR